jgi:hypothetical protein
MVGRLATGEIEEIEISSGKKGAAGGNARAARLSSGERTAIASKAARSRWEAPEQTMGNVMTHTARKDGAANGREAVRMYPSNQLRAQVRELGSNLSAFTVMKEAFTETK